MTSSLGSKKFIQADIHGPSQPRLDRATREVWEIWHNGDRSVVANFDLLAGRFNQGDINEINPGSQKCHGLDKKISGAIRR